MNAQPVHPSEMSLYDVGRAMLRRWLPIAALSGIAGVAAFAFYSTRPTVYRAEIVLDASWYNILFRPGLEFPVQQHEKLADSAEFLDAVRKRMADEGILRHRVGGTGKLFESLTHGKRANVAIVSISMTSKKSAARAAALWIEEYTRRARECRAARLAADVERELSERHRESLESLTVAADLRQKLTALSGDGPDGLRRDGIRQRIVELEGALAEHQSISDFKRAVQRQLEPAAGPSTPATNAAAAAGADPASTAAFMVGTGLDRLLSGPDISAEPRNLPAKVGSVFLTALLFSATVFVFADWLRSSSRAQKTP